MVDSVCLSMGTKNTKKLTLFGRLDAKEMVKYDAFEGISSMAIELDKGLCGSDRLNKDLDMFKAKVCMLLVRREMLIGSNLGAVLRHQQQ